MFDIYDATLGRWKPGERSDATYVLQLRAFILSQEFNCILAPFFFIIVKLAHKPEQQHRSYSACFVPLLKPRFKKQLRRDDSLVCVQPYRHSTVQSVSVSLVTLKHTHKFGLGFFFGIVYFTAKHSHVEKTPRMTLHLHVPLVLSLSGSGSLASLIIGLTATKTARTAPVSSTGLTGTISTALTASASSVNRPLNVSFCSLLHIFYFLSVCMFFLRNVEVGVNPTARENWICLISTWAVLTLSVFQ